MKFVWAIFLVFFSAFACAAEHAAPVSSAASSASSSLSGEVLEAKDAGSYTYLRLKTKDGEIWAAVMKTAAKKGDRVTIENTMTMSDFKSKSLNRTFKTIVFGSLAGAGGKAPSMGLASAHAVKGVDNGKIEVAKAVGANAYTVEEIVTRAAELKDKPVVLRGKIVKYNPAIMGKSWLHLRDGTGSEDKDSNDILVTTDSQAKAGEVVTVKGVVRTGKGFGAGYSYSVMIEDASVSAP